MKRSQTSVKTILPIILCLCGYDVNALPKIYIFCLCASLLSYVTAIYILLPEQRSDTLMMMVMMMIVLDVDAVGRTLCYIHRPEDLNSTHHYVCGFVLQLSYLGFISQVFQAQRLEKHSVILKFYFTLRYQFSINNCRTKRK